MDYSKTSTNLSAPPAQGVTALDTVDDQITAIEVELPTPVYAQLMAHIEHSTDQDMHYVLTEAVIYYLQMQQHLEAQLRRAAIATVPDVIDITALVKGA